MDERSLPLTRLRAESKPAPSEGGQGGVLRGANMVAPTGLEPVFRP